MKLNHFLIKGLAIIALLANSLYAFADDDALKEGKALFMANCASCHSGDMKTKLTGPGLGGVEERWGGDKQALYDWIHNSAALIAKGHPRAVAVFGEYGKVQMTAFPSLTTGQIDAILAYVDAKYKGELDPKTPVTTTTTTATTEEEGTNWFLWILFAGLAVTAAGLYQLTGFLDGLARQKAGAEVVEQKSLLEVLTGKTVLGIFTFVLICAAGYLTVQNAISMGRQQGYAPEQPIKFSHKLHAGKNAIPCQYCHDLARRSKHSGIPGVSTCINCHSAVKQGQHEGAAAKVISSGEILKIYASAGFDPNAGKYFPANTDATTKETAYWNWMKSVAADAKLVGDQADQLVADGVLNAKPLMDKPLEWIRIHNLPDHAYFNHSQHVVAGAVQCQTCHGPVETMELVYQYSPLSMGWCINCHRKTDVKFTTNHYYDTYFQQYHQELKDGSRDKVTVEEIGGLECQKCHY